MSRSYVASSSLLEIAREFYKLGPAFVLELL